VHQHLGHISSLLTGTSAHQPPAALVRLPKCQEAIHSNMFSPAISSQGSWRSIDGHWQTIIRIESLERVLSKLRPWNASSRRQFHEAEILRPVFDPCCLRWISCQCLILTNINLFFKSHHRLPMYHPGLYVFVLPTKWQPFLGYYLLQLWGAVLFCLTKRNWWICVSLDLKWTIKYNKLISSNIINAT
jgi:hypothetical protein